MLEYSPAGALVQGGRAALTKDGFARAELTNKKLVHSNRHPLAVSLSVQTG